MIAVALKGLARRKLRAALTATAIVLGVAMISGTYILTDTIKSAFGTVFTEVYKNTDVAITGKSAIGGNEHNNGTTPPAFAESASAGGAEASGGRGSGGRRIGHRQARGARRQGHIGRGRPKPGLLRASERQPALQPAEARLGIVALGTG